MSRADSDALITGRSRSTRSSQWVTVRVAVRPPRCDHQVTSTSTPWDAPRGGPRPFHRPPPIEQIPPRPDDPSSTPAPDEPRAPSPPAWAPLLSGVVVGSIVATVTGHALIALFGATALVTALLAWGSMHLVHRRRHRLWRNEMRRRRHESARHRVEVIDWDADRERRRHPTTEELVQVVRRGEPMLWSRRPSADSSTLWDVAFRRRSVTHRIDEYSYTCRDVPEVVSMGPGCIVGVHGVRSSDIARTLVLRLATHVGPSDFDVFGTSTIDHMTIPHWRGSIDGLDGAESDVHVVVLCVDADHVASRTSTARRLVAASRAALVVATPQRDLLPYNCTSVIDAEDVDADRSVIDDLAEGLSMWSDPDLVGSDVPRHVSWSEVYPNCDGDDPLILDPTRVCTARLGTAADGRVDVDLVRDGPHMVVIGTTGSGKSEFLRTLILGLAEGSSPDRLQFVLIDFKGGAAFDAVRELPHVVDVITDLDREAASGDVAGQRVVDGLRAELIRREHLLRERGASSLVDLELRDDPIVDDRPPRLVVVIDELARLQADVPEFVASLVDVAQRGRSLGIHLVVGTQTAGRVVSSEVLANADIRVALRLAAAGDSIEVVGSPIASRLPRSIPGRAVVRLGNDDPVVFQVASTGGELIGRVRAIEERAHHAGFAGARRIWCSPLPESLPSDDVPRDAIGSIDDRRHQSQPPYRWDTATNVLVVGSRRTGAESTLDVLIDRWSRCHRDGGIDQPLVVRITGSAVDDHETVDRTLRLVEERSTEPVLVAVEGIDTWYDRQASSRHHLQLWERFTTVVERRGVTLVATSVRDAMSVSRLGDRFEHVIVMHAGDSAPLGRGRVEKSPNSSAVGTTIQLVDASTCRDVVVWRAESLPRNISASDHVTLALRSHDLSGTVLAASSPFVVIGPRGSGRTSTLRRWSETWLAEHREARVRWIDSIETWRSEYEQANDRPRLVVIDDVEVWNRLTANDMETAMSDGWLVAAAVTPSALRARPEHPVHGLRRRRNGIVLGSLAHDDLELFGVFGVDAPYVEWSVGRGWLVDRGEVVDYVQVVRPASDAT